MSPEELARRLSLGDPLALSRAITLVENPLKLEEKERLLQGITVRHPTLRLGITGVPGVGKSTLIEQVGLALLKDQNERIAVLTIDPTSSVSKGSILGDKSRLQELARHERCYIRPSPTGQELGGVGMATREAILLCEAWGASVVIVETVGVGQIEIAVREMVDVLLLLALAGAGDELQGIKRGILELADVIAVTKADGENIHRSGLAASQIRGAMRLMGQRTPVELVSCFDRESLARLLDQVRNASPSEEAKQLRRRDQLTVWTHSLMDQMVLRKFARTESRSEWIERVVLGQLSPQEAVRSWVEKWSEKP